MQIYIRADLEAKLRQTSKDTTVPMSQLLAEALETYFDYKEIQTVAPVQISRDSLKGTPVNNPLPNAVFLNNDDVLTTEPNTLPMKMACCLMPKPCKHWVWDEKTGEGYINTITGEMREAQ